MFLPLILVLVYYSLKSFNLDLPLVKIKFIKTNVNVHVKIVWWFLEWVVFKWFRTCLSIYHIITEIKCKFKNSFETFGLLQIYPWVLVWETWITAIDFPVYREWHSSFKDSLLWKTLVLESPLKSMQRPHVQAGL